MSKKQAYIACVSAKYGSERVINAAECIANDANASLEIVSVLSDCADNKQLETVEYLHSIARRAGAQMTILYGDNPALIVADYIKRNRITHVIAGASSEQNSDNNDFVSLVKAVLPKVKVLIIPPLPACFIEKFQIAVDLLPFSCQYPSIRT